MNSQLSIFDLQSGLNGRDLGIEKVIDNNDVFIETARGVARLLARRHGVVSSDDVRQHLSGYGVKPKNGNAYGGIFRGGEWIAVGMTQSKIPENHGRFIRTWRLKQGSPFDAVDGTGA